MPNQTAYRIAIRAVAVLLLATTGCSTAYYAAWEKLGVHKRDLLRDNVEDARDSQGEASEQFEDALTRLKQMYGYDGGDLETVYDKMSSDYDDSKSRADEVRGRIRRVEQVAEDLFKEWEQEIDLLSSEKLRASSRSKLRDTRQRYADLHRAMNRAEASMEPVLVQFRDQVLYLKHNLNAQAIGSLQGEVVAIESDVKELLEHMKKAVAEANDFLSALPAS